ncbi:Replication initiator protein A [Caulifigura coniformis]|uniref:Replication initiator protein A n=1 Tax=Caulifigura coniformis TaxID=2527983 RepID=A0A517S9I6_9PLAN|nr:replication initiator protein A [Caulifigura coniformis]QDT52790.1 Replication initiator protein A [Caulifigura coniformis]
MGETERANLKTIEFDDSNRTLGTDELNLAEFPLAACGHRTNPNQKTLTFEDEIFDEGNQQLVHRKLIISASDAFGLPTPVDSDVLLVLMHLTNCRTRFQSPTVSFTRYELVKFLGWDNSGKSYRRLEESLQRWASVTLYYNRAWWDRSHRRWKSQTFHILESLDLRGKEGRSGPSDDGQSTFSWNSMLFSSFQSNHLKRLDLNTYFRLQIPAARQAYRFLDKRFYRSKRFEMDLRVFACEHVGLGRNYDSAQLKRKLQPALEELESIGFLVPEPTQTRFVRRRHGEWTISLLRQSKGDAVSAVAESQEPLVVELTDRGLRTSMAAALVREFPASRIAEKIELHDWMLERKDARISQNPAGYLAAAIREDYQPPRGFVTKAACDERTRKAQQRRLAEQKTAAAAVVDADAHQAAIRAWDEASSEQRAVAAEAALATGDSEAVAQYRKLENTPFAEMLLRQIVISHFKTLA